MTSAGPVRDKNSSPGMLPQGDRALSLTFVAAALSVWASLPNAINTGMLLMLEAGCRFHFGQNCLSACADQKSLKKRQSDWTHAGKINPRIA